MCAELCLYMRNDDADVQLIHDELSLLQVPSWALIHIVHPCRHKPWMSWPCPGALYRLLLALWWFLSFWPLKCLPMCTHCNCAAPSHCFLAILCLLLSSMLLFYRLRLSNVTGSDASKRKKKTSRVSFFTCWRHNFIIFASYICSLSYHPVLQTYKTKS